MLPEALYGAAGVELEARAGGVSTAETGLTDHVAGDLVADRRHQRRDVGLRRWGARPRRLSAPTPSTLRPPSGRSGGWSSGGRGPGRPGRQRQPRRHQGARAPRRTSDSPHHRPHYLTSRSPSIAATSKTATGVREGQRDRVCTRRPADAGSAATPLAEPAQQGLGGAAVLVGFIPIRPNVRRHEPISGSSLSVRPSSLDRATA